MQAKPSTDKIPTGHECGDSLLRCVECSAQVCPKCMIACPVGNRCGDCTKSEVKTHVAKTPTSAQKSLQMMVCAFFLGVTFSWLQWYQGNFLEGIFAFVFLILGWQLGQTYRRDKSDRTLLYILGINMVGMFGSTAVFALASQVNLLAAILPNLLNAVLISLGFVIGNSKFGCGS